MSKLSSPPEIIKTTLSAVDESSQGTKN